jgi:hypothetical protein
VLNGGLLQFFSNDTGVLAPEAVDACRALSMPALAKATEQAMAWFGSPYPRERDTRQAALASYLNTRDEGADPFEALDAEIADLIYNENGGIELAASPFLGVVATANSRFERSRGRRLRWAKVRVDDGNKFAPFVGSASTRRLTASSGN